MLGLGGSSMVIFGEVALQCPRWAETEFGKE